MIYSHYIIFRKRFTSKDCAITVLLNFLNTLSMGKINLSYNFVNRKYIYFSLLSSLLFIFIFLACKESNLDYDKDFEGIENIKTIDDIIEIDNSKMIEENEFYSKIINNS